MILKVVNATDQPAQSAISLRGVERVAPGSAAIVLTGNPEVENSLEHPNNVRPKLAELAIAGPTFAHTFPPYSLSILRINAQ